MRALSRWLNLRSIKTDDSPCIAIHMIVYRTYISHNHTQHQLRSNVLQAFLTAHGAAPQKHPSSKAASAEVDAYTAGTARIRQRQRREACRRVAALPRPGIYVSPAAGEENTVWTLLQNVAKVARCAGSRCNSDSTASRKRPSCRRCRAAGFFSATLKVPLARQFLLPKQPSQHLHTHHQAVHVNNCAAATPADRLHVSSMFNIIKIHRGTCCSVSLVGPGGTDASSDPSLRIANADCK